MTPAPLRPRPNILVWDLPVRVFHWLLVLCFAGARLTAESERWRLLHVTLGYTMGGLLVFRVLWGLVGTQHARFADFVRGPRRVLAYGRALLRGQPEHHVGHNPAGALAIVAMLGLGALIVASGWAVYADWGGGLLEELHEGAASVMLAVVGLHIIGVVLASRLHHENLVGAMLNGRKHGAPAEGIRSAWRSVAAVVVVAVAGFWWLQWQAAPSTGTAAQAAAQSHGDDDD